MVGLQAQSRSWWRTMVSRSSVQWRPTHAHQWKDTTSVDLRLMPEEAYPMLYKFLRSRGNFDPNKPLPRFPCQLRQLPWDVWVGWILSKGLEVAGVSIDLLADGRSWIRPFLHRMAWKAGGLPGQGVNPVYLNRKITNLLTADAALKERLLDKKNPNLGKESRLGAWLMDTAYTTVASLLMPSMVRPDIEYMAVPNYTYRQMFSAEPMLEGQHRMIYIGDLYEAIGWTLMELDEVEVLLWLILLVVLETETYSELNDCVAKRARDEHDSLLQLVYPDGMYYGAQWIDQLRS